MIKLSPVATNDLILVSGFLCVVACLFLLVLVIFIVVVDASRKELAPWAGFAVLVAVLFGYIAFQANVYKNNRYGAGPKVKQLLSY